LKEVKVTHDGLKVEIQPGDLDVTAVELLPKNWWSRVMLRVARWSYRVTFDYPYMKVTKGDVNHAN